MNHKFQVHLSGIIDLLSNHLYSGPQVFMRELLQNAVDAITARRMLEPGYSGEILIETIENSSGTPPTLVVIDNGTGLTEEEIHLFLSTIGQTSKHKKDLLERLDFIGQFGVGLLSCFVVSQEIVVITRSIKPDSPTIEWRGKNDGTYSIQVLEREIAPGTQVYLTAKSDCANYFKAKSVAELCMHYGSLLQYPIFMVCGDSKRLLNEDGAPWDQAYVSKEEKDKALLAYGKSTFKTDFLDCIELRSQAGSVEGVAYVLPYAPNLSGKRTHKVYLKQMLLSEHAEGLLPEWAFFVKCIVNANGLRPTASRESFYEDEALSSAREELGDCLRRYLIDLADSDPQRLKQLISLHYLAIKALSLQDDELYKLFINLLPFQTSLGYMTLTEYRQKSSVIQYVNNVDQFRQVSRIASAQGICLINAGYSYDASLIERLPEIFPAEKIESIEADSLVQKLDDLSLEERDLSFNLIKLADTVLQPFKCSAEVKKFQPDDVPALYSTNADNIFRRNVDQTREHTDALWSGILDGLSENNGYAQLCFNMSNQLVRKICAIKDRSLLERCIQMLYVQALLLGHNPLNAKEQELLNSGMLGLIEYCLDKN